MSESILVIVKAKSNPMLGLGMASLMVLALNGCSNITTASSYEPPKANSATDATAIATNAYAAQTLQAPSQIQIDFRGAPVDKKASVNTADQSAQTVTPQVYKAPQQDRDGATTLAATGTPVTDAPPTQTATTQSTDHSPLVSPASPQSEVVPEPQSFSGTIPCFNPNMGCDAQKVVLSLAPNGRWRSRTTFLEQTKQNGKPLSEQGCWRTVLGSTTKISVLSASGAERAQFSLPTENLLRVVSVNGQVPNLNYSLSRQPDLDPIKELDKTPAPTCQ